MALQSIRLPLDLSRTARAPAHLTQRRTVIHAYKHGPFKSQNPDFNWRKALKEFSGERLKQMLQVEWEGIKGKWNRRPTIHRQREKLHIFEHFDSEEAIMKWKPVADSDSLSGFSTSNLVRSPAGNALFTGVLDTRVPDDGFSNDSGFAAAVGPRRPFKGIIYPEKHYDWDGFNCIEIRFRGDGRRYGLVVSTADHTDNLSFYDTYSYPLYTRGGPYWQTRVIPFSKLIFCNCGFIQNRQYRFVSYRVNFVAITLEDGIDGPFAIEIDYIGLKNSWKFNYTETLAYEHYAYPHMKYKTLDQVAMPDGLDKR